MIAALLAATLTFTATATGVEKGTAIEFLFAGRNSDRDYESMFLLDESIGDLCTRMEKAGFPRGKPTDAGSCRFWPVGCRVRFEPALDSFVEVRMPDGLSGSSPVYTGGTRGPNGECEANSVMPAAMFSTYTLAQSPIVYEDIYEQGAVYGCFKALKTLRKGERVSFTVSTEENSAPKSLSLTIKPGNSIEVLKRLKAESERHAVDALIGFDGELSVAEATAAANALASVDSARVKINGCTNIFFRSFLPLVKWLDRKERLTQPFELTLGDSDSLVFIEEDWSGEGIDPKLTPKTIGFDEIKNHPKTDTCFIFADKTMKLSRIFLAMNRFREVRIKNWYVFAR